ncbi:glutaredoxin 3 [Bacillus oleivorans]|uniref:Glutaredoxin 3 n=1 Tax=Bacillus oleivorans TaxID=1448271 RepID=A0A285D5M5_9BACI|nr:glutaredoxin domain-containing protein [Bacillus oleivorans]SNX75117.1 glutaredoxin 3 [Bacillus oleivorans]
MNKNITLYTTTMCPICGMVRDFLTKMNIEYKEINVDFNPIEMIKLITKTRRFSVPQTNINGEWVFGFDPVRIIEVLNAKTEAN